MAERRKYVCPVSSPCESSRPTGRLTLVREMGISLNAVCLSVPQNSSVWITKKHVQLVFTSPVVVGHVLGIYVDILCYRKSRARTGTLALVIIKHKQSVTRKRAKSVEQVFLIPFSRHSTECYTKDNRGNQRVPDANIHTTEYTKKRIVHSQNFSSDPSSQCSVLSQTLEGLMHFLLSWHWNCPGRMQILGAKN